MKKKYTLIALLLISFVMTSNCTSFAEESELLVPITLQNLKGKDELVGYLDKISSVRKNIGSINISPTTAK